MKKTLSLLIVMILIVSLVACGSDKVIGKWNPEGVEGLETALMEFTETDMIILGAPIPYKIKAGKIIITTENGEEEIDFNVKGDVLTLESNGETQTFIKFKE